MKAFTAIALSQSIAIANGTPDLQQFLDPKNISFKNKSTCSSTATLCDAPDIQSLADQDFLQSQYGEDRCLIEQFFPGICQGKYLEVGALDGVRWSTTYVFYRALGWKGVNVEIDPDNYNELQHNRRDDIANVHAAVCSDSHKSVHYAMAKEDNAAGGIWEYSSAAHREQHWQGITFYQTIPVQCTPLQSILDQTVGTRKFFFDFAVLDLEGAEFSALLGIDYSRISFGVIIVERNNDANINTKITELLGARGYILFNVERECSVQNLWFTHENFRDIYSKLTRSPASFDPREPILIHTDNN